jgi:hypothetical protein
MTVFAHAQEPFPGPNAIEMVESELKRLREAAFESWKIYMTWYTWFFGANLIVLGWLLAKPYGEVDPWNGVVLAAVWVIFNGAGVVSTLRLRAFTQHVAARAGALSERLMEEARSQGLLVDLSSGFAGEFGRWGAGANAFSLAVNVLIWVFLAAQAYERT